MLIMMSLRMIHSEALEQKIVGEVSEFSTDPVIGSRKPVVADRRLASH